MLAYCHLHYEDLQESILQLCNSEHIVNMEWGVSRLNFFDTHITSVIVNDVEIVDIKEISYNEFIPDNFIYQFELIDNLPARIERFLRLGPIRFREELKNALQANRIVTTKEQNDLFIWEDYNMTFEFKEKSFVRVIV